MIDMLVEPIDEYNYHNKKLECDLKLKKLSAQHFTEEATFAAQTELDSEPSASREKLQDLIRSEATKQK